MAEPEEDLEHEEPAHVHEAAPDPHTHFEGRLVDLSAELPRGANVRIWKEGSYLPHETIIAASVGSTVEFRFGQEQDPNPINTHIEHLEEITTDTWLMHVGEMPWFEASTLYRAVMSDGSLAFIEKLPEGESITENRDKQNAQNKPAEEDGRATQ